MHDRNIDQHKCKFGIDWYNDFSVVTVYPYIHFLLLLLLVVGDAGANPSCLRVKTAVYLRTTQTDEQPFTLAASPACFWTVGRRERNKQTQREQC